MSIYFGDKSWPDLEKAINPSIGFKVTDVDGEGGSMSQKYTQK